MKDNKDYGIIADIGGTNARFALSDKDFNIIKPMTLKCSNYDNISLAVLDYLKKINFQNVAFGAFAVASAVVGDVVDMTNNGWKFSIKDVEKQLGLQNLKVVNDFVAQALAIPNLSDKDVIRLDDISPLKNDIIAVIGAGTGLGVSILVKYGEMWHALPTEGGHVSMASSNELEEKIIKYLREKLGHVSAEKVISGQGLVNIYEAISYIKTGKKEKLKDYEISNNAINGEKIALDSMNVMFEMLGTVSGNLVLSSGALGGIYISGGIIPRKDIIDIFKNSNFKKKFEEKGRFKEYMKKVPAFIVNHDYPAFLGLSYLIKQTFCSKKM